MLFTELKRDLIERIRQGNSDAFAELYKHYFLHVYGFSLKRLKSKDLAQECTQQTFIKIWERREHLDSNLNLSNYVFMICKNYILRAIQRMLREQRLKERFAFEHLPGSDDGTCTNEMEIAALR